MDTIQIIIIIIGVLISFFGFIGALLIASVGYFLRSFHAEYKIDKAKTEVKEDRLDERMQKMAEGFSIKLEILFEKFGEKINQLPKGSDNLSQVMLQNERDQHKRMDEHSERIQNNYTRIEQVAERVHALGNLLTPGSLRAQVEERKKAKASASI